MKVCTLADGLGVRRSVRKPESGETGKGQIMQGLEIKDKCI